MMQWMTGSGGTAARVAAVVLCVGWSSGVACASDSAAARSDAIAATEKNSAEERPLPIERPTMTGDARPTPATPSLDLSAAVIKKAITDSKDPLDDVHISHGAAFGAEPAGRQAIDQAFKRAEIPTCMTTEAYRFDPPQVGPFGLGGMLALPFLVHAIATGKCRY